MWWSGDGCVELIEYVRLLFGGGDRFLLLSNQILYLWLLNLFLQPSVFCYKQNEGCNNISLFKHKRNNTL